MNAQLEKNAGAFTPQSRQTWAEYTRSLDDGRYIALVLPESSAAGYIIELAAWYNGIGELDALNPGFVDTLMAKSNSLAYYLLRLSLELGELYADRNAAELRRKRAYFAALARLRSEADAKHEKFISAVGEVSAENEIADLKAAEVLADSLWMQAKLLRESGQDILQRMSQQISNLKSYREAVLRSDNSNANFPG